MPVEAEFEEREFESAFNQQIGVEGSIWTPGQVLEGAIGFDGAAFVDDPFLVDIFRYRMMRRGRNFRRGVVLNRELVEEVFDCADHAFPPFRFNFFAQHKRPTHVVGGRAAEWEAWERPYYRYAIRSPQNEILNRLERRCGQQAVVAYCCPVFHTKEQLWRHMRDHTVIANSNYAQASRLAGHHLYSFVAPGAAGRGHSIGEPIQGQLIGQLMRRAAESSPNQSASALVKQAGLAIKESLEDSGSEGRLARDIAGSFVGDGGDVTPPVSAVAQILALRFVFGTSLLLMTNHSI